LLCESIDDIEDDFKAALAVVIILATGLKEVYSMHPFYGPSSMFLTQDTAWWVGLLSMAMYLLFWGVVIIIAARMAKKYLAGGSLTRHKDDTAMTILRERYARGEIEIEEFMRKKEDLEKHK
jgi:putative membrane protein